MRLGVIGGTFDPIHFAHLFIAEEARIQCELDRVLFVPNAVSPFKTESDVSQPEHRLDMVRLAIAGNAAFEAARLEIDRPGPSYTVDTLSEIQRDRPAADLFFITGADAAAEFDSWHRPEEVLQLARLVVVSRPGYPVQRVDGSERFAVIETIGFDLSASEIRQRVRSGLPIRYLTPDPVVEYIEQHRLYR